MLSFFDLSKNIVNPNPFNKNSEDDPLSIKHSKRVNKILLVDDDLWVIEELTELLEQSGFYCEATTDGYAALELIIANKDISIVITDLKMPGLDGISLIEKLHQKIPDSREIAIIICTGHANTQEAIKALQLGAVDFLIKPISPSLLKIAINNAIKLLNLRQLDREFRNNLEHTVKQRTKELVSLFNELAYSNQNLKEKNQQLKISNQAKSQFITLINHELRTPLTAIIGASKLIDNISTDEKTLSLNKMVITNSEILLNIISCMINLVDMGVNDAMQIGEDIQMTTLINNVVNIHRPTATFSSVTIEIEVIDTISMIKGDRKKLEQAFNFILTNAIQFSPKNTTVFIRVNNRKTDDTIVISVSDSGKGMNQTQIQLAVQPFSQVDSSDSKSVYGIGLGLTLSGLFTELHGGRLVIESQPDKGTTVNMILPAANSKINRF